jgi:hypothetical protein
VIFLHRLQQRRLGARAGAVDLVGHQQAGRRPGPDEAEGALAVLAPVQHFRAEDVDGIRSGVNWTRLVSSRPSTVPSVSTSLVLARPGTPISRAWPPDRIAFRTNVGDVVEAGPDHPLRFEDENETGGLKPYILVRDRLEALINRPVMYELIEHGEEIEIDGTAMFAVRSHGEVYPIMPVEKLKRLSA